MKRLRFIVCGTLSIVVGFVVASNAGQATPPRPPDPAAVRSNRAVDYRAPEGIDFRTARITSEGVQLHAELFSPTALAGKPLPTIIMAHGWGGTAAVFRRDAVDLARAGYLVLVFDYRGWGESDARLVLTKPSQIVPTPGKNQTFTAEVTEVREYVDPLEQTTDWFNVINWAVGEPAVDKNRIGIRGSSYSGGHVFYVAAHDSRVTAAVSQAGAFDSRWVMADEAARQQAFDEGTKRAHGATYPAPRAVVVGSLIGAPIREKLMLYAPIEQAARVKDTAVLFIVAEKEELFSNADNAKLAHDRMAGAKKKYVSVPGTHYAVYREQRDAVVKLAVDWFNEHLTK